MHSLSINRADMARLISLESQAVAELLKKATIYPAGQYL
jgi:hypothetical protein